MKTTSPWSAPRLVFGALAGVTALAMMVVVPTAVSAGQWPVYLHTRIYGDTMADHFGAAVANVGDIDNDGVDDFIIGAPSKDPEAPHEPDARPGYVWVFSGATLSQLYRKDGAASGDYFGFAVAGGGDLDGDDPFYLPEFVVGAPGADPGGLDSAGSVYVYSGTDGSLAFSANGTQAYQQFGWSVAVTTQGYGGPGWQNMLIVGSPTNDTGSAVDNGSVYCYDASGSLIVRLDGESSGDWLGYSVANAGYQGGGTGAGFVVAAPYADPGAVSNAGRVYVYDGDVNLVRTKDGAAADENLGWSVANVGDVNLDGRPDIAVGAPGASPNGIAYAGRVYVYSGSDGSLLFQIDGTISNRRLGWQVAAAGDVDGDLRPDILVGSLANTYPTSPAIVYSGLDGSPMVYIRTNGISMRYGMSGVGDVNADGKGDFVIGDPYTCGPCPSGQEMEYEQAGTSYLFCSGYRVTIQSLVDVGNDQGRQIRLQWKSLPGSDDFVKTFAVYRRFDGTLKSEGSGDPLGLMGTPPGTWDFVQSIPARGDTLYSTVVPTVRDSTVASGMAWSVFFVSGLGENPLYHFDSPIDSGYSLDNLAPAPPPGLEAAFAGADVALDWGPVGDSDFDYYRIYRDTIPGFSLSPATWIGSTSDTVYLDTSFPAGKTLYYRVTALDFSGNEGDPSNEAMLGSCVCPCHGDPQCDGVRCTVQDVVLAVNVAFRGSAPVFDPNCPRERTDVNCDGFSTVQDVVKVVNVAFRGGNPATEFCDPCAP